MFAQNEARLRSSIPRPILRRGDTDPASRGRVQCGPQPRQSNARAPLLFASVTRCSDHPAPPKAAAVPAEFRYFLPIFPSARHRFINSDLALSLHSLGAMNTPSSIVTQELCIRGELAETYEGPGLPVARIHVNSVQLDVPMCFLNDAHLGDEVVLEVAVVVKRVVSYAGRDGPHD